MSPQHLIETTCMRHSSTAMELDLLERRIRRLVAKLEKQNIHLEVFNHEDIEYGSVLGKGGEGIVQRCTVIYNELPVEAAVKTVLNNSDDALNITLDEIELLCLARDPIITTTLQVYGVAAVPEHNDPDYGHLVIITEAGFKNALQLYQDEGRAIPLHVTYDFWSRLAAALHCIHHKRIIHQDLKPENILVTAIMRDIYGCIDKILFKIIDLGMGRRLVSDKVVSDDIVGTNGYHAPEVLFDDSYDIRADIFMLGITFCVMLLPTSGLRKATLQAFLKKIHDAKEQKTFGRNLFTSIIEPSVLSGAGVYISTSIRNMLCTMLERLDRRSITLLDVVALCNREETSLRIQESGNRAVVPHPSTPHVDSGIDSMGDCMASQRTLHKIELLESHVLRQTSPRRLRSCKKQSPSRVVHHSVSSASTKSTVKSMRARKTPTPQRRRSTVRTISVSTTSSDTSRTVTPRKPPARRCLSMSKTKLMPNERQTRQSAKRTLCDIDSGSDNESRPVPAKRVLRSSSYHY